MDNKIKFYVGLHHPLDVQYFDRACVSIRTIWKRRKPLVSKDILLDSGAFTELNLYGKYITSVKEYAEEIKRLYEQNIVNITGAVAQDYMCEPFMLKKTGFTIEQHQQLTIERYDELISYKLPFPIIPVLQGYEPETYINHIEMYDDRLKSNMWTGVGSVCKRNGSPEQIFTVLSEIKNKRPDLKLHGFGVKYTSLANPKITNLLHSADSMAWSFAARKQGRDANDWREAKRFSDKIELTIHGQPLEAPN